MIRANRPSAIPAAGVPALIHPVPCWWSIALLASAGLADAVFAVAGDRFWGQAVTWLLLGALIAAIPCVLSNLTETPPTLDRFGTVCRVSVILLCIADLALRTGQSAPGIVGVELTFFAASVGVLGAIWPKRWAMIPAAETDEVDITW